jgi:prophage antirepressor-like protein
MTADLMPFTYEGSTVRTVIVDESPWFVARDICNAIGLPNLTMALQRLAADEKGVNRIDTPGGRQEMAIVSESGMYALVLRSDKPEAAKFRRWVTAEVLPAIRKTGSYSLAALPDRKALARMVIEAEEAREIAEARAEEGEKFKRAIEAGDGLGLREFHKKYFSAVTETEFMDHLYSKGYLIDQRGKGSLRESGPRAGTYRDGSQHRHPSYKGKQYFYRHGAPDRNGIRRENTHVRPGTWELALRDQLAAEGLTANEITTGLFVIEGGRPMGELA